MRSTRASAAVDRLKRRSENPLYSIVLTGGGLFCLVLPDDTGANNRLCQPMLLDDFVSFVNAFGPQLTKRVSKLDVAFAKQLGKTKS